MSTRIAQKDFVSAWQRLGSPTLVAKEFDLPLSSVYSRRKRLEGQGIRLETRSLQPGDTRVTDWTQTGWTHQRQRDFNLIDGAMIVSSDHHYWPGAPTTAHRALIEVIGEVKPRAKVLNGDIFDGGGISRHPPFGWSEKPKAIDELHTCQERVGEIEQALPKGCDRHWNIGNHCMRFERTLATSIPEFANLPGLRLSDHFPGWEMAWSMMVNPDARNPVMVKHRHAGGVHAGYNNTMKGGLTVVTGHTHILEVKPWGDYRGRRWGVQTGTLADCNGPQFEYQENSPSPACSGFVVLTFNDGQLLPPELCEVIEGKAYFRGRVVAS